MIRTFRSDDLTELMHIWLNANLQAHGFIPADYWKSHFEQVKQLLDHAKSFRQRLTLHVYQKNEGAVHFYLREGFLIQSQAREDSTGETEYMMSWRNHL